MKVATQFNVQPTMKTQTQENGIIFFQSVQELSPDNVTFIGEQIEVSELKKLISQKLGLQTKRSNDNKLQDIAVMAFDTRDELANTDKLRTNSRVVIERRIVENRQQYVNSGHRVLYCANCVMMYRPSSFLTYCCRTPLCQQCEQKWRSQPKCMRCLKQNLSFVQQQPIAGMDQVLYQDALAVANNTAAANASAPATLPPNETQLKEICAQARFFVIKSCNLENVKIAKDYCKWATTVQNQSKLNEAFRASPHVVLIFAVNRNNQFMGCARMECEAPRMQTPLDRKLWCNIESIKLGGNFNIRWLRIDNLSYSQTTHIVNDLNKEQVIKCRDTQEVGREQGTQICLMFRAPQAPLEVVPTTFRTTTESVVAIQQPTIVNAAGSGTNNAQGSTDVRENIVQQDKTVKQPLSPNICENQTVGKGTNPVEEALRTPASKSNSPVLVAAQQPEAETNLKQNMDGYGVDEEEEYSYSYPEDSEGEEGEQVREGLKTAAATVVVAAAATEEQTGNTTTSTTPRTGGGEQSASPLKLSHSHSHRQRTPQRRSEAGTILRKQSALEGSFDEGSSQKQQLVMEKMVPVQPENELKDYQQQSVQSNSDKMCEELPSNATSNPTTIIPTSFQATPLEDAQTLVRSVEILAPKSQKSPTPQTNSPIRACESPVVAPNACAPPENAVIQQDGNKSPQDSKKSPPRPIHNMPPPQKNVPLSMQPKNSIQQQIYVQPQVPNTPAANVLQQQAGLLIPNTFLQNYVPPQNYYNPQALLPQQPYANPLMANPYFMQHYWMQNVMMNHLLMKNLQFNNEQDVDEPKEEGREKKHKKTHKESKSRKRERSRSSKRNSQKHRSSSSRDSERPNRHSHHNKKKH